jgi:hypothetical protein
MAKEVSPIQPLSVVNKIKATCGADLVAKALPTAEATPKTPPAAEA